jgi:hypothetical protein
MDRAMDLSMQGHHYLPLRLAPDRTLAAKFLYGQGVPVDGPDGPPDRVPPTDLVFLRGETHGVDLFRDLGIPRQRALHGGPRYKRCAPVGRDAPDDVTVTVDSTRSARRPVCAGRR